MKNFDDSTLYNYKLLFSSKLTRKLQITFATLFLVAGIIAGLLLIQLYTFYQIPSLASEYIFMHIFAGLVIAPLVHHIFHAIAYIFIGAPISISMIESIVLMAPKFITNSMILKRQHSFMLLAPFFLGNGVILLLMALAPSFWYVFSIVFIINIAMSAIDIYWVINARKMHHAVVMRSAKHGFNVYKV